MFGKLPEIFGRDFIVGYLLPSAVFVAASTGLITAATGLPAPLSLGRTHIFEDITVLGLISWLGGTFLLAINRGLIRIMEGYGLLNPARLLRWLEVRRFIKLTHDVSELNLEKQYRESIGEEPSAELQAKRIKLMRTAAERFPDNVTWLLPTAFGNTIRAFEVYPRVIYGLDSIYGWNRLLAVIPKDYRELVDAAKAQMDLWVNFSFLSLLMVLEYPAIALCSKHLQPARFTWWTLPAAILFSRLSCLRARAAALEWGDLVKSSFDVFLPSLRKKLEFAFPNSKEEERRLWTGYSQAIIYRLEKPMPPRVRQADGNKAGSARTHLNLK